ncbi:hypothetical protein J6590_055367 [Homalodisca vitripennis]|nr:hypothetical protein J6590_055367 [Homalodisca vitripennis]
MVVVIEIRLTIFSDKTLRKQRSHLLLEQNCRDLGYQITKPQRRLWCETCKPRHGLGSDVLTAVATSTYAVDRLFQIFAFVGKTFFES